MSLQRGDVCFIVGHPPESCGFRHNNKVVTLTSYVQGHVPGWGPFTGWNTDPVLHDNQGQALNFSEQYLKPFDKDLLKDEINEQKEITA